MNGVVNGLGAKPHAIGGVEDHLHLLVGFKPSHTVSDFMREFKRSTGEWARANIRADFRWQDGYAVFSVGSSSISSVRSYIAGQEEHHKRKTYLDELKAFLDDAGIAYEDRFLV